MLKHFTMMIVLSMLGTTLVLASESGHKNLQIDQWLNEWVANREDAKEQVAQSFAVVRKVDDRFETIPLSQKDAPTASFLVSPSPAQIAIAMEINKSSPDTSCNRTLWRMAKCLNVELLLDITSDEWKLFRPQQEQKKITPILTKHRNTAGNFLAWLNDELNYDGVILDQKGDEYLALVPPNLIEGESQALILSDSSAKNFIAREKGKGGGILFVEKIDGRFAILKLLVSKSDKLDDLKPGTKIVVQKAKIP